jgi:bifunctional non-homologous end joining protein LigD
MMPEGGGRQRHRAHRARRAGALAPRAVAGARRAALPQRPSPQLAATAAVAPSGDAWLHEAKLDGYRMLALVEKRRARLLSRNGKDWTARFAPLAAALAMLPVRAALIDGEVVHLDSDGHTSFSALKDALATGGGDRLVYFAFDLLHLDGYDLSDARLDARKALLQTLIDERAGRLRYSDHVTGHGGAFQQRACAIGLEGIVSKRADAPYRSGRGDAWRKIKCVAREELVIIGWTDPAGARQGFGALLLGYFDRQGAIHYAGRVGTGFSDADLNALRRQLDRLRRDAAPSRALAAAAPRRAHWVAPELVAELRFSEWTRDGRLRHPVFLGLRDDKRGRDVIIDPPRDLAS